MFFIQLHRDDVTEFDVHLVVCLCCCQVDPSCSYRHLVTIDRFDAHFQLAGGINLPKVLSCMGSDGKRRRQLVKVGTWHVFNPFPTAWFFLFFRVKMT